MTPQKALRSWRLFPCLAAFALALVFGASCSLLWLGRPDWEPPQLVSVEGVENCAVLHWHGPKVFAPLQKGRAVSVLVRNGDVLFSVDKYVVLYQSSDGHSLALSGNKARDMLNGTTVTLQFTQDEALKWLQKATREQIRGLRLLNIGGALDAEQIALLHRIAQVNPEVGLWVDEYETWTEIAGMFDPAWLQIGGDLQEKDLDILTKKKNIRTLAVIDPEYPLTFLSGMTALETLMIEDWDPLKTGPLPDNLASLRRIVLLNPVTANLSALGKQPELLELNIQEGDSLEDLTLLSRFPDLRLLSLHDTKKVQDLGPLKHLRHVQWLSLPEDTTQEQLGGIIQDHPNLIFLDLSDCEKVNDLTPIGNLAGLRYLMAPVGNAGPEPLYQMKHLKWLAVAQDKEDQENGLAVALQEALPHTVVVRLLPVCLGSGWILVLMPAMAAVWWMAKRRERKGLFLHGSHG